MTKITVIPTDKKIVVDGKRLKSDGFTFEPGIHAIQWDGKKGHIEYIDDRANVSIESEAGLQAYIDMFNSRVAEIEAEANIEKAAVVSARVTMRQARLALFGAGLLASIQPAIDAMDEPDRTAAQIEWDYSSEVLREKSFVNILASNLGWTDEQLDNLFREAATL